MVFNDTYRMIRLIVKLFGDKCRYNMLEFVEFRLSYTAGTLRDALVEGRPSGGETSCCLLGGGMRRNICRGASTPGTARCS